MSIDVLQEKIRKTKNPSVLELTLTVSDLPSQFARNAEGYASFCREILEHLHGFLPAVRFSFSAFALLGHDGLYHLSETLKKAAELGYYVLLDAPEILSPASAKPQRIPFWERIPSIPVTVLSFPGILAAM